MKLYFRILGDVSPAIDDISRDVATKDLYHQLGELGYQNIQLMFQGRLLPRSIKTLGFYGIRNEATLYIIKGRTGEDIINTRRSLTQELLRRLDIKFIDLDNLTPEIGVLRQELVASQLFTPSQANQLIKNAAEKVGYLTALMDANIDTVIEKSPTFIYSSPTLRSSTRSRSPSPRRSSHTYSLSLLTLGGRLVTVEVTRHMKYIRDLYDALKAKGYGGYKLKWRDVKKLNEIDETSLLSDLDLMNDNLVLVSPMKHELTTKASTHEQIHNFKQEIMHDESLAQEAEDRARLLRDKIEAIRTEQDSGDVSELYKEATYAEDVASEIRARIEASKRGLQGLLKITDRTY